MSEVVAKVHSYKARSAASMAETINWYCQAISITVGECFWLSTDHLNIPLLLSHKLVACFVGPFSVLWTIGPVSFKL